MRYWLAILRLKLQIRNGGYRWYWSLAQDPTFEPVRDDPRFTAWVARMKEDLARQRDRVEAEGIAAVLDSMIAAGSRAQTKS